MQKRVNKCEKVTATSGDAWEFWNKALSKYKRSCNREIKSNLFDLQNKQSARTWGFSHPWLLIFVQITPLLLALISLLTFVILANWSVKIFRPGLVSYCAGPSTTSIRSSEQLSIEILISAVPMKTNKWPVRSILVAESIKMSIQGQTKTQCSVQWPLCCWRMVQKKV